MKVKDLFETPINYCGFTFQDKKHRWLVDTFEFDEKEIIKVIGECKIDEIIVHDKDELIVRINYESED